MKSTSTSAWGLLTHKKVHKVHQFNEEVLMLPGVANRVPALELPPAGPSGSQQEVC